MKKIFLLFISLYSLNITGQTSSSTKALIDSSLPTNGVKAISATNLRTTLKAIVDYSDTKAPINNPTFTGTTNGITTNSINVNTEFNLLGQKDGSNNNSKITITNQGSGADSRLTFTQSNYLTGAGWQFGEDILNVHGSYFGFAGNSNPQANIDLGTSGTLKIGNLAGIGKVLTSDATGNATWSTSTLDAKVDKIIGKGLSTNDFTNAYKAKADSVSLKQNLLNGTGFVKSTAGIISYDNSTYLTTAAASSTYATQANLALKANSASPTFTTGTTVTGTPSNTVQSGPFLHLNGGSGSSFSTIQQGIGTLDFYGFNGSGWVNNLSINNANGNVGIGINPISKLHIGSTTNINTLITVGNPLGGLMLGHGSDNEGIITGYSTTNLKFGNNFGFGFIETMRINADGKVSIGGVGGVNKLNIFEDNQDLGQVVISGKTNTSKNLILGYNTTSNYGTIQAVFQGISYSNLILNRDGGNVGIGTPAPSGILDVVSTTMPSYPFPRMTTTQVNALTGMTAGAWVFDTTTNHPKYYNGSAWVQL